MFVSVCAGVCRHTDRMRSTHMRGDNLPDLVYWLNVAVTPNTLPETPVIIFDQISGHLWPSEVDT